MVPEHPASVSECPGLDMPCLRLASPGLSLEDRSWVLPRAPEKNLTCDLLMLGSLGCISWPNGMVRNSGPGKKGLIPMYR